MTAIGGSLESITLDSVEFSVMADANVGRKRGGFENEVKPTGDGNAVLVKRRVPWALSEVTVPIDNARGDLAFLQSLADRLDYFPVVATYPDGTVDQGVGQIEGEISHATGDGFATLNIRGVRELTAQ